MNEEYKKRIGRLEKLIKDLPTKSIINFFSLVDSIQKELTQRIIKSKEWQNMKSIQQRNELAELDLYCKRCKGGVLNDMTRRNMIPRIGETKKHFLERIDRRVKHA